VRQKAAVPDPKTGFEEAWPIPTKKLHRSRVEVSGMH
jgi:hypothetical protein